MNNTLVINNKDNVAVLLEGIENIEIGHKIALRDINEGELIIKYGETIGIATCNIKKGEWVHTHNCFTNLNSTFTYTYNKTNFTPPTLIDTPKLYGYYRKNNKVGIRNELWIITTVGCVNSIATIIKNKFMKAHSNTSFFDGIYTITHPYGCSQMGDDLKYTSKILKNIATHPNAGGVLILGLGCENNNIEYFKENFTDYEENRIRFLNSQDEDYEIEKGISFLEELYENLKSDIRKPISLKDITIGVKCGGSDAFSGITSNPLVGKISDRIVAAGGSIIMGEVPEMFGSEHILMNRAKDINIFNKIVDMINSFKSYFTNNNVVVYDNPSPGNKKGGITTLEEKSLGCIQKCGKFPINYVLDYGEKISTCGVNLLNTPGNDLVATTALGASGAQLVLFTTGRGTPFGTFIPTIKISSNSPLYNKKKSWIDFNAGEVLNNPIENIEHELFTLICNIINGDKTLSEEFDNREIAIFKTGVTL